MYTLNIFISNKGLHKECGKEENMAVTGGPLLLPVSKAGSKKVFLISTFRHVLNVACFLLGNSQASEFYMPTFRNTLSVPSS
jgi:hypothetical protein